MDYTQEDTAPSMAAEAALAFEPTVETVSYSEIERDCLPLEESKRLVLEMVHLHFHPTS